MNYQTNRHHVAWYWLSMLKYMVDPPYRTVLFWKGFMSQWNASPFRIYDMMYPTAEHYMMAEKARIFGDYESMKRILSAPTPAEAKSLGRQVQGYDDQIWTSLRYDVVVQGNLAKFTQNPDLLERLCSTNSILAEASPHDSIWGIGMDENEVGAAIPRYWKGQNLLGFALMEVREMLRS